MIIWTGFLAESNLGARNWNVCASEGAKLVSCVIGSRLMARVAPFYRFDILRSSPSISSRSCSTFALLVRRDVKRAGLSRRSLLQSSSQYARGGADVPMLSSSDEGKGQDLEADRVSPIAATLDLEPIRTAIKGIRFGEVRIVIQDGVVIQIDRMEKKRIR